MSIFALCGLTGSGKTYLMTRIGISLLEKSNESVQLYACYHIYYPPLQHRIHYFNSMKELVDLENSIVLIDEGSIWFNSRLWNHLDPRVQYKFLQHRKDGLRIYVTSQFFDGMDKVVRQNTHKYFEIRKIFGSDEDAEKVYGLIRMTEFAPRAFDKIRRSAISTEYFLIRRKYVDMFNTHEKVNPTKKISSMSKEEVKEIMPEAKLLQAKLEDHAVLEKKRRGRPRKKI